MAFFDSNDASLFYGRPRGLFNGALDRRQRVLALETVTHLDFNGGL